jgi:hypothetical protein
MCVNERSYRSLPHYPELLERYGVRQLHVDIVRPESTGERDEAYLRDIMPRYSDMAPYYAEMLAGFDRVDPDFDVNVGNLPYCILPEWASRIHHGGQETVTKSSDGAGLEDEMNKYEWQSSLRTYVPACSGCVFRSRCTGIFRTYLELHGAEEFHAVSRDALAALDVDGRTFVLLVEPLLAPLRVAVAANELPAAWRLQQEITEDRRRRIEIVFAHETGALARLCFAPPGSGRAPVIGTASYDVDAGADLGVPPEALAQLLEWARGCLAAGLGAGSAPQLADDALERAMRASALMRGRQRVTSLALRLQHRFAHPGWHFEPLSWPSEGTGELVARGPGGARVDVCFTLGARGSRSQVGIDFRVAEASDPHSVRAAIDELVEVLRGPRPAAASAAAPGTAVVQ